MAEPNYVCVIALDSYSFMTISSFGFASNNYANWTFIYDAVGQPAWISNLGTDFRTIPNDTVINQYNLKVKNFRDGNNYYQCRLCQNNVAEDIIFSRSTDSTADKTYFAVLLDTANECAWGVQAVWYSAYNSYSINVRGGDNDYGHNLYALFPIVSYNWQSVSSISGKNGILTLSTLNDVNDGEPVETSDTSKFILTDGSNVSALVAAHFSQ